MAAEPAWEFDWDESNLRHLARHRISQAEFEQAMRGDPVFMDIRYKGGEERWYPLGATEGLRILFLVFTFRGERTRPITGWTAGKKLRESYLHRKRG